MTQHPGQQSSDLRLRDPNSLTLAQVWILTLTLLYERVAQDMRLVWKVAGPVVRPVGDACQLLWRHAKPSLEALWKHPVVQQVAAPLQAKLGPIVHELAVRIRYQGTVAWRKLVARIDELRAETRPTAHRAIA